MVKLAPNAMTTLDTVRALLDIPQEDTAAEIKLSLLINAASGWFEKTTARSFRKQEYIHKFRATGCQEICLEQWPILDVACVIGINGEEIVKDAYSFSVTGEYGVLYKDDGWTYVGYPYGLAGDPIAGKRYLEIRYTAGYVLPKDETENDPRTLPYDIEEVIWGIVMQQYGIMKDNAMGLSSFSVSDVSWTWDKNVPEKWREVVNRYAKQ